VTDDSNGQLTRIAGDLSALRAELATFTKTQEVVNLTFREHIIKSAAIGEYHEDTYEKVHDTQKDHAARLRAVEDWRVEMKTLGWVLRATFGVSVVGLVIGLLGLANMIITFGR